VCLPVVVPVVQGSGWVVAQELITMHNRWLGWQHCLLALGLYQHDCMCDDMISSSKLRNHDSSLARLCRRPPCPR
jgi:hypothetical protein